MATYARLTSHYAKVHRLNHARSMLQWDAMTMAVNNGGAARAGALAELEALCHERLTEPWLDEAIKEAAAEPLDEGVDGATRDANLREMARGLAQARAIDPELVRRKSMATSECLRVWMPARAKNSWDEFKPALQEVLVASREEARQLAAVKTGPVQPYEALMDLYEPEARTADLDAVFAELRTWLPDAIRSSQQSQAEDAAAEAAVDAVSKARFPLDRQEAFLRELLPVLGFDLGAGRFDVIKGHPFCGGVPEDVRITTRLSETDFVTGLMGVIHETGHARYEQGRPRDLVDQPVGQARSIGLHESQSLFFEMQMGRSTQFVTNFLQPRLVEAFPEHAELLTASNLLRLYRRVKPGKIRVDADELTYPLHVGLRYNLERDLINGDMELDDLPGRWCAAMEADLGITLDADERFKNGCMQDMHWAHGAFGYFPTYTIGAASAAQLMRAARKSIGDDAAETALGAGDVAPFAAWLKTNVWDHGCRLPRTDDVLTAATGEKLNVGHYAAHLRARAAEKAA